MATAEQPEGLDSSEPVLVPAERQGSRLDAVLSILAPHRSRSEWQRLIEAGAVHLNDGSAKPATRVSAGDRIRLLPVPEHVELRADAHIPLRVVYEDGAVIVVDKPPGLVVHPAPGNEEGTLVNALLARYPDLRDPSGELRPGIVHRLDKDTSGLIVIGRTARTVADLQAQMKRREVDKRYLLLVSGIINEDRGRIDAPMARSATNRQRMAVRADGKEALTEFQVLERLRDWTLLEARIHTGRTHQLRVHFRYIGHPVAADRTYGSGRAPDGLRRQFIHAATLAFRSPTDGRPMRFEAPLPDDLANVLESLRILADQRTGT